MTSTTPRGPIKDLGGIGSRGTVTEGVAAHKGHLSHPSPARTSRAPTQHSASAKTTSSCSTAPTAAADPVPSSLRMHRPAPLSNPLQQSVPFARVVLFFCFVTCLAALAWVLFCIGVTVLTAPDGKADGFMGLLALGVAEALPGIALLIAAALGGVQAELSITQNRFQNVMLEARSKDS